MRNRVGLNKGRSGANKVRLKLGRLQGGCEIRLVANRVRPRKEGAPRGSLGFGGSTGAPNQCLATACPRATEALKMEAPEGRVFGFGPSF